MTEASMPACETTNDAAARAEGVKALLALLSRPGSRLRTRPDKSIVVIDTNRRGECRERVAQSVAVASLRHSGWLTGADDAPGDEALSAAGRSAYRRLLMAEPARNGDLRRVHLGTEPVGSRTEKSARSTEMPPPERRSVLDQIALRKDARGKPLLDHIQHAAGQRLAHDFAVAQLQPRVTARWSAEPVNAPRRRSAPGTGVEITETAAAARERVRRALSDLGGELADLVLDVCCFDRTLQAVAATRYWSTASARLALALALGRLALHYGMISTAPTNARLRQWAETGFRPTADSWTGKGSD